MDETISAKARTLSERSFLHAMPILHLAPGVEMGMKRTPGTRMRRAVEGIRLTPSPARTRLRTVNSSLASWMTLGTKPAEAQTLMVCCRKVLEVEREMRTNGS